MPLSTAISPKIGSKFQIVPNVVKSSYGQYQMIRALRKDSRTEGRQLLFGFGRSSGETFWGRTPGTDEWKLRYALVPAAEFQAAEVRGRLKMTVKDL
jgi:hypothetical protein